MRYLSLASLLLISSPALAEEAPAVPLNDIPVMHEEHESAGVSHVYDGPWEYFVGGGGAAFDCNGDRKPDMLLAGGKNPAQLFINESAAGGALKFREGRLDLGKEMEKVAGAYPLDVDGDGHMDVVLLRVGQNVLLKGNGDCTFSVANREWSFDGGSEWTTAFRPVGRMGKMSQPWPSAITWTARPPVRRGVPAMTTFCFARNRAISHPTAKPHGWLRAIARCR